MLRRRGSSILALTAVAALAAPAAATAARPGLYKGKLYKTDDPSYKHPLKGSSVKFRVKGHKLRNFRTKGGQRVCIDYYGGSEFQFKPLHFYIPSARIKGKHVKRSYTVTSKNNDRITNELNGRFAGRGARGTLSEDDSDNCAADYRWKVKHVR